MTGQPTLERLATLLLGLTLAGGSIEKMSRGERFYENYLSWKMLAPSGLIVGSILVMVAVFWSPQLRGRK